MRRTRARTIRGLAIITLAFGTWASGRAEAAAISSAPPDIHMPPVPAGSYSTSGTVGSSGVTGPGSLSFNGITKASLVVPSAFSLGDFQALNLPDGKTTTFTDTPFQISFLSDHAAPVIVSGVLNGSMSGSGQSNVVAQFQTVHYSSPTLAPGSDPIGGGNPSTGSPVQDNPSMAFNVTGITQDLSLSLTGPRMSVNPADVNGGLTTVMGQITPAGPVTPPTVPEPTSITIFLTALLGAGVARYRRRIR